MNPSAGSFSSTNEHAIAVAIKAITRVHGMFVRRKHSLASGKSANQGEQRGTRQMKIGKQCCNYLEPKARNNKDLCLRLSRMQQSSRPGFRCLRCRIFQSPN